MTTAWFSQTSFSAGELSPLLEGRQDLAKYSIGLRKCQNFLVTVQGPLRKRGGTGFIAEVKDSTKATKLHPFVKSETDAVVIEFGNSYNRFYASRGPILSGMSPYEIVSPYASVHMENTDGSFAVSMAQSVDVTFLANPNYEPYALNRTSNTSWAYVAYNPDDGPFNPENIDASVTVQASAVSGSMTITNHAAFNPIAATDVGRLIRLASADIATLLPWEPGKQLVAVGGNPLGLIRVSDNKVYECATNTVCPGGGIQIQTGTVKPEHTAGTFADGDGNPIPNYAAVAGVLWTYLQPGYGIARITAVAMDGSTATATVISNTTGQTQLPQDVVDTGTYRWSMGAWYSGLWPSAVGFFRDRLTWSGVQRVWSSVSDGYTSQAPDTFDQTLDDNAIDITISVGPADTINWMQPTRLIMLIGTGGNEVAMKEINASQAFSPSNVQFQPQTSYGSRKVQPINVSKYTLWVQTGGLKLRESSYDLYTDQYVAADLTSFSEHITASGLVGLSYAQNPYSLVWCQRSDGHLACLTYERDQQVLGWSEHVLGANASGAIVTSLATIPGTVLGIDDTYLIVHRTINGVTKRYVEVLLPPYTAPNDPHAYSYFDCSLTYDGTQSATITLGTGFDTVGSVIAITAGSAIFSAPNVGREIHVRTYNESTQAWTTAIVTIDTYTDSEHVSGTVIAAFPQSVYVGGWMLTAKVLTGFDHLEGETIQVVVDGAAHPDCLVASGSITLNVEGAVVHGGYAFQSIAQTMNVEAGSQNGTAQGKIKKIATVVFRVQDTLGGEFGPDWNTTDAITYRKPKNLQNESVPLYTGDLAVVWPKGYETDGRITFVHAEGFPCTLAAIYAEVTTEDHRTGSRY